MKIIGNISGLVNAYESNLGQIRGKKRGGADMGCVRTNKISDLDHFCLQREISPLCVILMLLILFIRSDEFICFLLMMLTGLIKNVHMNLRR